MRNILAAVGLALAICAVAPTTEVQAQAGEQVQSNVQGTVGLGMIGAELGFAVPALLGAEAWWWYLVCPVVGAAAGIIAGYFAIDQPGNRDVGVAMLVTGIALALPTLVLTVAMTAYDGDDDVTSVDDAQDDGDSEDDAEAGDEKEARRARSLQLARVQRKRRALQRVARAGSGLLRFDGKRMLLGVPGFGVTRVALPSRGDQAISTERVMINLASGAF